jgi:hypothetical protein
MDSITLKQALALALEIKKSKEVVAKQEVSQLWNWVQIGHGIIADSFKQADFVKQSGLNKTEVSMAVKVARGADTSAKFRKALEDGKFGSLRSAWESLPKQGGKAGVSKTITVKADGTVVFGEMNADELKAVIKAANAALKALNA